MHKFAEQVSFLWNFYWHNSLTSLSDFTQVTTFMLPIRRYSSLNNRTNLLHLNEYYANQPNRGIGMLIARVVRGALKIRYLFLGGTLAGGTALAKVRYMWFKFFIPGIFKKRGFAKLAKCFYICLPNMFIFPGFFLY